MTAFEQIVALVKQRSGLALSPDQVYLVETRLAQVVRRLSLSGYEGIAPLLHADQALQDEVVEALTTHETLFFRDRKPFDHLCSTTLPRLHAKRPPGMPLRIWSAGTSSGQEAYSIAMQVREMDRALDGRGVRIVATDIARGPLARARAGLYSQFEVGRGVPSHFLAKYFTKETSGWRINKPIRDLVEFREWNLLADPRQLGPFDAIFCRNVLLYFDAPTKACVLDLITRQLTPDGLLYLGGAETITGSLKSILAPVSGVHFVFEPVSKEQTRNNSMPRALKAQELVRA